MKVRPTIQKSALAKAVLGGVLLIPVGVLAQDSIELGAGYNSEDSFKMGQYSGLTEKEGYGVSAISIGRSDPFNAETARYWRVTGDNLGLDTRSIEAEAGYQGRYGFSLSWQELPHYRFDNPVSTPFLGAGTAVQRLPGDWTGASSTAGLTGLQTSLHDIAINTDREKLTMELDWRLNPAWSVTGNYQHENKQGNDTLGAIFGSNGGNPRGAVLAAPVDYETDTFHVSLARQGEKNQTSIFYRVSMFNNANKSLKWDNPFNNPGWAPGAGFDDGAVGEMALAPDNRYWQTGVSSVQRLGESSRLSASLTLGRMTQDENFLPYSNVFSAATPLPATSLDGEVNTVNGLISFTTRPGRKTSLRLRYSHDERNNDTRVHLFQRIPGDAAAQGDPLSSNARLNRPYSFRNQRLTADADYRFTARTRLSFGVELEDRHRNRVDVERTREHTGHVKLSLAGIAGGRGWLQYSRSRRDGSAYIGNQGFLSGHNPDFINTLAGNELYENDPLLRRFHLADRDRDEFSFNFNLMPAEALSLDIIGKLSRDDFPDSAIGVQESARRNLTLNLNYDPSGDWHAYTYVTAERYLNKQQGYSRRGGGNPTPFYPESVRLPENNWWMESEDRVITAGAGADWLMMQEKLDLSLDINRSDATTETSPSSTGLAYAPFADIDSTLTGLSLEGSYNLASGNKLGLRYRYEKYDSTDFALDRVAVDTLSNVILLGNASPNYSGYIVELTFLYTFPNN